MYRSVISNALRRATCKKALDMKRGFQSHIAVQSEGACMHRRYVVYDGYGVRIVV